MGAANKASKGGKVNDDRRRLILDTAAKLLRQHGCAWAPAGGAARLQPGFGVRGQRLSMGVMSR